MDKKHQMEPWQQGVYETGRTRPPKSHSSTVAVLLVVVIFLGGMVSALSVLNVRLFTKLNEQPQEPDPVSFVTASEQETPTDSTEAMEPENTGDEEIFDLNPSPDSVENIPQEGGLSLQDIYDKNIGSVVSISCRLPGGSAAGTGVIASEDGFIVTNSHVVEGAYEITVRLTDERILPATLIGADAVSDLAVLRVEAEGLQPAEFGDSDSLRVGDSVAAIGDPLGMELRGTLTNGIVSAINRNVSSSGRTLTLIQTNAALNSGNSGGPLINCFGQVIGINTMKIGTFSDGAGVEGLGFAIPSTTVQEITEQLITQGYVSGRPTLGLAGEAVSNFYQHYYRLPPGLFISEVDTSSSAYQAGITPGDILISIDGVTPSGPEDLQNMLMAYEVGDNVTVIIFRSGRQYRVDLTLTEAQG